MILGNFRYSIILMDSSAFVKLLKNIFSSFYYFLLTCSFFYAIICGKDPKTTSTIDPEFVVSSKLDIRSDRSILGIKKERANEL